MLKKLTYIGLIIVINQALPVNAGTLNFGIEEIIEIGEDLNDSNASFKETIDYVLGHIQQILEAELSNDCPDILRIVPGECPHGSNLEDIVIDELPTTSGGYRRTSVPGAEFFNSNPTVVARDFANLYDQEYARAKASRLLGSVGSNWLDKNALQTSLLVTENELLTEEVAELTKKAHTLDVTQDVMKNSLQVQSHLAQITLNQSKLNAQMQASLLSLQQQQASLMQLNANLGEAFDEANRRQRLERDALYLNNVRAIFYVPGFEL